MKESNLNPLQFMKILSTICIAVIATLSLQLCPARAGVPEPDNILYGSVIIDGVLITSNRTDVTVEARRTVNGPAIASYRMGDRPNVGNNYSLRVPIESAAPLNNPNASLLGDDLFITVKDASGDLATAQFPVTARGTTQRLDFVFGDSDGDGDGLPDAWENLRFGNLAATGSGNNDGDHLNNLQEFIAGTNPNDPASVVAVRIDRSGDQTTVSFDTIQATGTGYEGRTRRYTLEESSLLDNDWHAVTGFLNVTGNGQTVSYQPPGIGDPKFYRARVTLE